MQALNQIKEHIERFEIDDEYATNYIIKVIDFMADEPLTDDMVVEYMKVINDNRDNGYSNTDILQDVLGL